MSTYHLNYVSTSGIPLSSRAHSLLVSNQFLLVGQSNTIHVFLSSATVTSSSSASGTPGFPYLIHKIIKLNCDCVIQKVFDWSLKKTVLVLTDDGRIWKVDYKDILQKRREDVTGAPENADDATLTGERKQEEDSMDIFSDLLQCERKRNVETSAKKDEGHLFDIVDLDDKYCLLNRTKAVNFLTCSSGLLVLSIINEYPELYLFRYSRIDIDQHPICIWKQECSSNVRGTEPFPVRDLKKDHLPKAKIINRHLIGELSEPTLLAGSCTDTNHDIYPMQLIQHTLSVTIHPSSLCINQRLFNSLFGQEMTLLDQQILVCGFPNGNVRFSPVRTEGIKFDTWCNLKQPIVSIVKASVSVIDNSTKTSESVISIGRSSGLSERDHSDLEASMLKENALIFVGIEGKLLIAFNAGPKIVNDLFTQDHIIGPISACFSKNDFLLTATKGGINVSQLILRMISYNSEPGEASIKSDIRFKPICKIMQRIPVYGVDCICECTTVFAEIQKDYDRLPFVAVNKNADVMLVSLDKTARDQKESVKKENAPAKVKTFLKSIEQVQLESFKWKQISQQQNSILAQLSLVSSLISDILSWNQAGRCDAGPIASSVDSTFDINENVIAFSFTVRNLSQVPLLNNWLLLITIVGRQLNTNSAVSKAIHFSRTYRIDHLNVNDAYNCMWYFDIKESLIRLPLNVELMLLYKIDQALLQSAEGVSPSTTSEELVVPLSVFEVNILDFVRQKQNITSLHIPHLRVLQTDQENCQTPKKNFYCLCGKTFDVSDKSSSEKLHATGKRMESRKLPLTIPSYVTTEIVNSSKVQGMTSLETLTPEAKVMYFLFDKQLQLHDLQSDIKTKTFTFQMTCGQEFMCFLRTKDEGASDESFTIFVEGDCLPLLAQVHEVLCKRLLTVSLPQVTKTVHIPDEKLRKFSHDVREFQERVRVLTDGIQSVGQSETDTASELMDLLTKSRLLGLP